MVTSPSAPAAARQPLVAERWLTAASDLTASLLAGPASADPFAVTAEHAVRAAIARCAVLLIGSEQEEGVWPSPDDGSPHLRRVPDELLAELDAEPSSADQLPRRVRESTGLPAGPVLTCPLSTPTMKFGVLVIIRDPDDEPFSTQDVAMMRVLVSHAALLVEHLQSQRTREARVLQDDRNRIAGNLHDLVIQHLFGVGLRLQALAPQISPPDAAAEVESCVEQIDDTIRHVRRSIFALQQRVDDHPGLRSRILNIVTATPFPFEPNVNFNGPIDSALPDRIHEDLLASLGEILTNVIRHAKAHTVDVIVSVDLDRRRAVLRVTDDGVGWGGAPLDGHGTGNIVARAARLGGSCGIASGDGGGTDVQWCVPLDGES